MAAVMRLDVFLTDEGITREKSIKKVRCVHTYFVIDMNKKYKCFFSSFHNLIGSYCFGVAYDLFWAPLMHADAINMIRWCGSLVSCRIHHHRRRPWSRRGKVAFYGAAWWMAKGLRWHKHARKPTHCEWSFVLFHLLCHQHKGGFSFIFSDVMAANLPFFLSLSLSSESLEWHNRKSCLHGPRHYIISILLLAGAAYLARSPPILVE